MDSNLEIPDKDSGLSLEKVATDATSSTIQAMPRKRKQMESKKREVLKYFCLNVWD